jgi:hypothetical protein
MSCATDGRIQNLYFKNITFDGGGSALVAVSMRAARNVVFDQVTFQNYRDPKEFHRGLISGAGMLDGIWFRGCHFVGQERWALYLDGAHGSGVVESQIDYSFGSGGLLFLSNDDFSEDYNGNGAWDPEEIRFANYVVVAHNRFGPSGIDTWIHTGMAIKGANALVADNFVDGYAYKFAVFDTRCSQRWGDLTYAHIGHEVSGNRVQDTATLVTFDASGSEQGVCVGRSTGPIGNYTVRDNIVRKTTRFENLLSERGQIIGPNVLEGNRVE